MKPANEDVKKEIISLLSDLSKNPEGFYTREELEDILGWGGVKVLKALKLLAKQDLLETSQVIRENVAGIKHPVYAYKLKTK
jgi:predicted DNA-binding ArsR family transcriptional regulator